MKLFVFLCLGCGEWVYTTFEPALPIFMLTNQIQKAGQEVVTRSTNEETEIPKIEWLIEDHTTESGGGAMSSLVLSGLYHTI